MLSEESKTNGEDMREHRSSAVIDLEGSTMSHAPQTLNSYSKGVPEKVQELRRSFNSGTTRVIEFRKTQLKNLLRLLEDHTQDFVEASKKDLGRPAMESLMLDINLCKYEITRLIWNLNDWMKPERPAKPLVNLLDSLYIVNEPYGVVLVIGSWNFPVNLLLGPVAGAIAAGNCVVMKPSEVATATEQLIVNFVPKYLDQQCYCVYTGGAKETTVLLQEKFDYIFFTGSTSVGKLVHAAANNYLTPVTLELGGKNPVYLDSSVDIELAAKRLLFGKYCNAGQICIAPDYVLCTSEVQDDFITAARKVLGEWCSDAKSSPDYCKIVSEKHYLRLINFLQERREFAVGGSFDADKRIIEPTILKNVHLNDPLMKEEIFGPILPLVTVKHIDEAISIINEREKPLVLYIFTNDKKVKKSLIENCLAGGVLVNDTLTHFIVDTLPFGGVGMSGMGSYHGKKTFDTFVHKKSVLDMGYSPILEIGLNFRYPPYTDFKMKIINLLTCPKRGISSGTIKMFVIFLMGILFAVVVRLLYCLATNTNF